MRGLNELCFVATIRLERNVESNSFNLMRNILNFIAKIC